MPLFAGVTTFLTTFLIQIDTSSLTLFKKCLSFRAVIGIKNLYTNRIQLLYTSSMAKKAAKLKKANKKAVLKKKLKAKFLKKLHKKAKKAAKKIEKKVEVKQVEVQQPVQEKQMHIPVMLREVIEHLVGEGLPKRRVIVDMTMGMGGHSRNLIVEMAGNGKLIGFDMDPEHLKIAKKNLKNFGESVVYINSNFENLAAELEKLKIKGIDAILFDLGIASNHVDDPEKGFSFMHEGPLDMRFNKDLQQLTAAEVVNKYSEKELIRIFKEYGEENKARKIAAEIVKSRRRKPFETTTQLANFIEKLIHRDGRIHPATRVFQALRIEVNRELEVLQNALKQATELLRDAGRIAVISYHSLEDRIVKHFFRDMSADYINLPNELKTTKLSPKLKIVTKKPLMPTAEEVKNNPRSRSAKLRVAEKI